MSTALNPLNAFSSNVVATGEAFTDKRGRLYFRKTTVLRNKAGQIVRQFTNIVRGRE